MSDSEKESFHVNGFEFGEQITNEFLHLFNNPHTHWETIYCKCGTGSKDTSAYKSIVVNQQESRHVYKCQGILDCPPAIAFEVITDPKSFANWDSTVQNQLQLEEFDEYNHILYHEYISTYPLGSILYFIVWRRSTILEPNKRYCIVFRSVEHPKAPKVEGGVRGGTYKFIDKITFYKRYLLLAFILNQLQMILAKHC
jgi:hypothetical protein